MFARALQPEQLTPQELDDYLEIAWFRMGQTIFTTNFIHFKEEYYSTLWLRIALKDLPDDGHETKRYKRNAAFHTQISPATLTPEKEELYAKYKQPLPFQPSETLHTLLFGKSMPPSIYNTLEVAVYDQDRLIAFGFFDMGANSAAGIVSVYDPAYKKFSLGKYLIYQKIKYCRQLNLDYFYPGYFVPGYPLFDYKLTIGKSALQFFKLATQQWTSIQEFSDQEIPILTMKQALLDLQQLLQNIKIESTLLKYEFFDANLVPELRDAELFDYPWILTFSSTPGEISPIIVYDVQDGQYHILKCFSVWTPGTPNDAPDVYSQELLKIQHVLFSHTTPEIIANLFSKMSITYNA